jgi:hypothetical protein
MSNWSCLSSTIRCRSRSPSPSPLAGRLARPATLPIGCVRHPFDTPCAPHTQARLSTGHGPRSFTCSDSLTGVINPGKARKYLAE